jgi:putative transcriptional regulator
VPLPKHHVGSVALLGFAAGSTQPGPGLAIACHLDFCPQCRADVAAIESVTGAAVAAAASALAGPRARLLDALAPTIAPAAGEARVDSRLAALGLPQVLRRSVAPAPAPLRFKFLLPGIEVLELSLGAVADGQRTRARLMRFRPGVTIPHHDHEGDEHAVVLRGSFHDQRAQFCPGDVCLTQPGAPHHLRVDPGEICIALIVNQGRIIPHTRVAKLLARLCGE